MKVKSALSAAACGLLALSAAAPAAVARSPVEPDDKRPPRQCFWADQVSNYAALNDRTVFVRVGVKQIYQLDLLGACPEIDWSQKIAIVSRGGSTICSGLDATLVTPTSIGARRCAVKSVRKLSEPEIAALPSKAKP